jgi:hypothetical protein
MKKIFFHPDFTRVDNYQLLLEARGINSFVQNKNASSILGDLPHTEVWPELWIANDSDYDAAMRTIEELDAALEAKIEAWDCPKCGEAIEEGFGECWNCGLPKKD